MACLELAGDSLTDLLLEERINETRFGHYFLTRDFMKHFSYEDPQRHDRNRPCLCPQLKVIPISNLILDRSGDFGCALSSRIRVTPLNKVRILCTDAVRNGTNIQERDEKKLEELRRKGIHVYLARDPCDGL